MPPPKDSKKPKINYKIPRPSASVILINPQNEVLLLHRVKTSSSFPSAHVFPGGNISSQDGDFPPAGHPDSHDEGIHYRRAAIREMFEESGILLAKNKVTGEMVHVTAAEREEGRHAIHQNKITFDQWLKSKDPNAEPDTDPLVPFSHWITPITNPRRFTTQMYLYFLPLANESNASISAEIDDSNVQVPTSDGGLEITEAQFLPPSEWLARARAGKIIMFPPQVMILTLVAQYLQRPGETVPISVQESAKRRAELLEFNFSGEIPWAYTFISPRGIATLPDGRTIMDLSDPGPELKGSTKKGYMDRVTVSRFTKEGPKEVDVHYRSEIVGYLKAPKKAAKSAL
ncbi:hypothetical protein FQN57_004233 [Myotisia sp. PD_48]|nr:hypothetical protein FQN57_004233 [Myotisia sp. PD_48]